MKKFLWIIFGCLCSVIAVSRFADSLIKSSIKNEYKIIIAVAVIVVIILSTVLKSRDTGNTSQVVNLYRKEFGKYIDSVFKNKKVLKKRFEVAICNIHLDKYESALKILDSLYKKCETTEDYCGVLVFKGVCYENMNRMEKNIEVYEEVLNFDNTLSDVWLYLAIAYLRNDDYENYMRCNQNCLVYEPNNAYAFSNIGTYYLRTGNNEKALEYALRAIGISANIYQAMGTAAAAYCIMGDMENCEKYRNMYIANGGNAENIDNYISSFSR